MMTIFEYMRGKLDWAVDRIAELLTRSKVYKVQEVKARIPNVRQVVDARQAGRFPSSGPVCDRY
jgi:hypothetical protein